MQDIIQRTVTISAAKETIYDAITDPGRVVLWFPSRVEGTYEKGEQPVLDFGRDGRSRIYIVNAVPHSCFAFRWVPGSNDFVGDVLSARSTLVEFRIKEETNGRCIVTMTDSGFAALPAEAAARSYGENSDGWDPMMRRLENHLRAVETGIR